MVVKRVGMAVKIRVRLPIVVSVSMKAVLVRTLKLTCSLVIKVGYLAKAVVER